MAQEVDSDDESSPASPPAAQQQGASASQAGSRAPQAAGRAAGRRAGAVPQQGRAHGGRGQQEEQPEQPGSLAARLSDLGRRLLAEIEDSGASSSPGGGSISGMGAKQAAGQQAAGAGVARPGLGQIKSAGAGWSGGSSKASRSSNGR